MISLDQRWCKKIEQINKQAIDQLPLFLRKVYDTEIVYPPEGEIFNAFNLTPPENVKIVILGQDPYHGAGQAHGLAFSCKAQKLPPSLKNILKELKNDLGICVSGGDLTSWAQRGVLLLNTSLSVREGSPLSHNNDLYRQINQAVINILNDDPLPKVFLLWGEQAAKMQPHITNKAHLVLSASHPSPLSARHSFIGCRHFSKANEFLIDRGRGAVDFKF